MGNGDMCLNTDKNIFTHTLPNGRPTHASTAYRYIFLLKASQNSPEESINIVIEYNRETRV